MWAKFHRCVFGCLFIFYHILKDYSWPTYKFKIHTTLFLFVSMFPAHRWLSDSYFLSNEVFHQILPVQKVHLRSHRNISQHPVSWSHSSRILYTARLSYLEMFLWSLLPELQLLHGLLDEVDLLRWMWHLRYSLVWSLQIILLLLHHQMEFPLRYPMWLDCGSLFICGCILQPIGRLADRPHLAYHLS